VIADHSLTMPNLFYVDSDLLRAKLAARGEDR
jgi:hypothetical protein